MQIFLYPNDLQSVLKDLIDFKKELNQEESVIIKEIGQKLVKSLIKDSLDPTDHEVTSQEVWQCGKNTTLSIGVARSDPDLPKSVAYLTALLIGVELSLFYLAKDKDSFEDLFEKQEDCDQIAQALEKDKIQIKAMVTLCAECFILLTRQKLPEEVLSQYKLANIHFDNISTSVQDRENKAISKKTSKKTGQNYFLTEGKDLFRNKPSVDSNKIEPLPAESLVNYYTQRNTDEPIMVLYNKEALFSYHYFSPRTATLSTR